MRKDPRYVLATAAIDWRRDRPAAALAKLEGQDGPEAAYLRALCAADADESLKAAVITSYSIHYTKLYDYAFFTGPEGNYSEFSHINTHSGVADFVWHLQFPVAGDWVTSFGWVPFGFVV